MPVKNKQSTCDEPRHYSSIIGAIGSLLGAERFPISHRASLKRFGSYGRPGGEIVALRLLIASGAAIEGMGPAEIGNWKWLAHCMALLSGPGRDPHSAANEASPGTVLHGIGYSDIRLGHLLDARGQTFNTLLERAAWSIAQYCAPIDWSKIAPLVLTIRKALELKTRGSRYSVITCSPKDSLLGLRILGVKPFRGCETHRRRHRCRTSRRRTGLAG